MSSEINKFIESMRKTGGPAYPLVDYKFDGSPSTFNSPGLTIHDWFAGQALMGILAQWPDGAEYDPHQTAKAAYEYADAMITERNKQR